MNRAAAAVASLLVVAGAVALVAGGVAVGREDALTQQLPYLVSGGFAGGALVVTGSAMAGLLRRRAACVARLDVLRAVETELLHGGADATA